MIIVCKNCKSSFLVPATSFTSGARTVRCAKCKNVWREVPATKIHTPNHPDAASPPPFPQASSVTPSTPRAAVNIPFTPPNPAGTEDINHLKRLHRYALIAVLITMVLLATGAGTFVLGHNAIIQRWPEAQELYIMLGLARDPLKDNLALQNIVSERKYVDGAMQLVVQGEIHSFASKTQIVPAISVEALGPDGRLIESWRIEPPKATMAPNMTVPFTSSVISPEGTVVEINLSFVEPPHDEH